VLELQKIIFDLRRADWRAGDGHNVRETLTSPTGRTLLPRGGSSAPERRASWATIQRYGGFTWAKASPCRRLVGCGRSTRSRYPEGSGAKRAGGVQVFSSEDSKMIITQFGIMTRIVIRFEPISGLSFITHDTLALSQTEETHLWPLLHQD